MSGQDLDDYLSAELLEQLGDAVTVIDPSWHYVYVSARAAAVIGRTPEQIKGEYVWDVFPEVVGTPQHAAALHAMDQRERVRIVWYFDAVDTWFEQHALPIGDGLVVLVNDVSEQQLAAHRAERLVTVGETIAGATSEEEVNLVVTRDVLPLLGAAGGSLVMADEERGVMHAVGWHNMAEDFDDVWHEYPLTVETPSVWAWRTGEAVYIESLEQAYLDFPVVAPDLERIGRYTVAAVPLVTGSARLGALVASFAANRAVSIGEQQFLATVAAIAAQAITRVRLMAAEQRSIVELQRSLLPRGLPSIDGLDIAVRYLASDTTTQIGGDWYDVVPLPGGAVGLVMGDVEGHDLGAAALMGLVHSAVRAYAQEGQPPAFVVERANAFLAGLARDRIVTLSYAQIHPHERLVTTVSAGHPCIQVVAPQGDVFEIPSEVGPPLGVFDAGMRWNETTSTLPAGCAIAMYTDGLVEVRGSDIDEGIERVRATMIAERTEGADELADALLGVRSAEGHDDVALLTARLTATSENSHRLVRRLPANPASVFLARRFARQVLATWDLSQEHTESAELVVSELATNAARHSEDDILVGLSLTDHLLRVEVGDTSHRMPVDAGDTFDDEATSGRGLVLVQAVASRWGVESEGLSKTVWAEFDL